MATQDDYIKTALRLPRTIHAKLQEAADATGKSMNAEIIARLEESFANTGAPNLVAALARLSMSLALANADKISEQLRAVALATYVRQFAELLLPHLDSLDDKTLDEFEAGLQEANEYMHSIPKLRSQAAEQGARVRQALEHMRLLGGLEESDNELESMLNALEQSAGSPGISPPLPTETTQVETLEPPKRPKRIVRPASKKPTEK